MYQALYRKWRPQTFSDVVGQSAICDTLRAQVESGRTSHAYLFVGSRGTGKTTCAKILSKAVNCLSPVNGDPCNKCSACLGITSGAVMDVVEIDAASNNSVDDVRELRDEAIYSPANVKKRVYIIDEVHMFSNSAFNALLKILEEPPEHVVFVLATTELHKVPATILSRCQRFTFKRIDMQDIKKHILQIAQNEGISITSDAAEFIARLSDGGMRDALSIFDQCAAYGHTNITRETLEDVIGLAGTRAMEELVGAISARDTESALNLLASLYDGGRDLTSVLGELSAYLRDLLVEKVAPGAKINSMKVSFESETVTRQMDALSKTRLISMLSTISEVVSAIGTSANKRIDAEVCIIKLCTGVKENDQSLLLQRIEELESKLSGGVVQAPVKRQISTEKPVVKPVDNVENPVISKEKEPEIAPESCPPPADTRVSWAQIIDAARGELSPGIMPMLKSFKAVQNGDILTLSCENELAKKLLKQHGIIDKLQAVALRLSGSSIKITIGEDEAEPVNDELSKLAERLKGNENVTIIS